ncbi:amino acid adenylation domain-containing protein [Acidovorax sp. NCPPB 3576]|uniref:amino acid adenylation domain-containing protein n=1 Tax=Acidovorax sp. NCPPB 3576 TaxID=2940488 RepID=UPI00234A5FB4|nr:amino acid adenylation domain-containing protein [Acidovorax sp. NCPPB 3576]WCM87220.1 amino acid adenylation domain-containing protein [Acidovorax sp. NCPPB 3576]
MSAYRLENEDTMDAIATLAPPPAVAPQARDVLALPIAQDEGDILPCTRAGDEIPLSFAQEQLWFLQRLVPGMTAYNLPRVLKIDGPLDPGALERAFQAVLERHAILRTAFIERDGVPLQVVQPHVPFQIERIDASDRAAGSAQAVIAELAEDLAAHVFALGSAPALVARLVRLGDHRHLLGVCLHHIVTDAASNPILARDLGAAYGQALRSPGAVRLPVLPLQYGDFAVWQRAQLENGGFARQLDHWNAHLGSHVPVLELPLDGVRSVEQSFRGDSLSFTLEPALCERLLRLCRAERCTPFMVLLAAWQMLLCRYSGQTDFGVGVPNAGRHRESLRDLLGFFISTQVFRARLSPQQTLRQICRQVRADALAALEHADLPLEALLASRKAARDGGRNPLFQVMFSWQVADPSLVLDLHGARAEFIDAGPSGAKADLSLNAVLDGGKIHARLEYNTDLFGPETAQRLRAGCVRVLEALADDPDGLLGELDLLDAVERLRVQGWGEPGVVSEPMGEGSLHARIERHAKAHPAAIALVLGDRQLSYGQLNRQANQLAHHLIGRGVGPEVRVGLAVERSLETIVGMLAILKAGGAYVPLDPQYPADRLAYMAQDSAVALVLTHSALSESLAWAEGLPTVELDTLDWQSEAGSNPGLAVHPEGLAYVIYTSGSTGRPKGAQLSHRNATRLLDATQPWFRFGPEDTWTLFHSYAFDFSVWEIFGALCTGGRLVIVPYWVSRSPQDFVQLLREQQVTVLNQTPSAFGQLMEQREAYESGLALRCVIFGGEALEPQRLRKWIDHWGDAQLQLINMYGITETTVHVTYRPVKRADLEAARSPVGVAIPDLGLRVLDGSLQPVPIGLAGELYVAGEGLARGYLAQAALTAQRFIAAEGGQRLYRTGDRVRWSQEGELEYLGRIDHQVKIRGFRIELGEIEAQLLAQPEVREAVVLVQERESGARLVAYLSPQGGQGIDIGELRKRLGQALPEYMVPGALVVVGEGLPLNGNGKVDRKALGQLATAGAGEQEGLRTREYEAPRGEVEQALAQIWAQVLGLERVGRNDNFFEIGGDSIVALKLLARMNQSLAADHAFSLQDLMQKQTIAQLLWEAPGASAPLRPIQRLAAGADPSAMPLFCIAPALRNVLDYQPLADALGKERPVYGLCCTDLSRIDAIEALAAYHVDLVRSVCPQGPVALLGWSLGATEAVYMACLLEAQGREVAFIGMVDSFVMHGGIVPYDWREEARTFLADWVDAGAIEQVLDVLGAADMACVDSVHRTTQAANALVAQLGIDPGQGDMVEKFMAYRRLDAAIMKLPPLPSLRAVPDVWWRADRPPQEVTALADQLGGRLRLGAPIGASHRQIIQHGDLLQACRQAIRATATELPQRPA